MTPYSNHIPSSGFSSTLHNFAKTTFFLTPFIPFLINQTIFLYVLNTRVTCEKNTVHKRVNILKINIKTATLIKGSCFTILRFYRFLFLSSSFTFALIKNLLRKRIDSGVTSQNSSSFKYSNDSSKVIKRGFHC